ncbi:MAG: dihydropteroate synthase [Candidatus Omnitrophota bacterium]|nr:dihydropteroate synthase [Candidatus Omnitrophota bacterium]
MKPLCNNSKALPQDRFILKARKFTLKLGKRTQIMGILNLTPDSFTGDGLYRLSTDKIIKKAEQMVRDGADILDIGGESTRPGAKPISEKEEIKRVIPPIKILAKRIKIPISIDTYKSKIAELALDNGASIVNDITAFGDNNMPKTIKRYNAAVVLMHMRGKPLDMQNNPHYRSLITEITGYLQKRIKIAVDSGISSDKIIIDPGIGFGKTLEHNMEIIRRLAEFKKMGFPVLIGTSRKSFIGQILNKEPQGRLMGTAASIALSIANGADIVRVHDVREMHDVVKIIDAITRKIIIHNF